MKKLFILLSSLLCVYVSAAQSIIVAGGCADAPITLSQSGMVNGKPAYKGTGTIAGFPAISVSISWLEPDDLWVLSYDGQPFYSNACATGLPPGTANGSCTWTSVTAAPCASPQPLSVTGDVALSAAFGAVSAYVQDHRLYVNWTTLSETNNDRFEIEISEDGQQFKPVATVKSKAVNGESKTDIRYEWKADGNLSLAVLPWMGLLVILLVILRRKNLALLALAGLFITIANLGCGKKKDSVIEDKAYFVRIAQVDKDGTKSYSRIVKIVEE